GGIGSKQRIAEFLQEKLFFIFPLRALLRRPPAEVSNEMERGELPIWSVGLLQLQVGAIRGPVVILATKRVPDMSTEMGLTVTGCAGKNERYRFRLSVIETF